MVTDPLTREVFDLGTIAEAISAFEGLLRRRQTNLHLPSGSSIETAGLAVLEMIDLFHRNLPHAPAQWHRKDWREAIALADMLRKVLRVDGHPCFDRLWPHLMLLLGDGNIALNVWNPPSDAQANKVFELYMALVVAPLSQDLELDHPVHSSGGKNPDVIAELDGVRWGFSCKVMHTDSTKTFVERVRGGIDQIQRSVAAKEIDCGVVVVSLKNLLPHDYFWTMPANSEIWNLVMPGPIQPEIVARMFQRFCAGFHKKVIAEFPDGASGFQNLFKGTKAVPAVLLHLCSTVSASLDGKPSFHFMRMFGALHVRPLPPDLQAIFEKLNLSLHNRFSPISVPHMGAEK